MALAGVGASVRNISIETDGALTLTGSYETTVSSTGSATEYRASQLRATGEAAVGEGRLDIRSGAA